MSCKHIVEDSTFVISLMNKEDAFHKEALSYENASLLTTDVGMKAYETIFNNIYCFREKKEREEFIKMINISITT